MRQYFDLSRFFHLIFFVIFTLIPSAFSPALAAQKQPVPRFVSLRSDTIVMRAGPGQEYPIRWRLRKKGLPVKVIAEYDTWRQVECHDGTKGWIHQSLLSGHRTVCVIDGPKLLYKSKSDDARPIANLSSGVIAPISLKNCTKTRCPVKFKALSGWVNKEDVWGFLPKE